MLLVSRSLCSQLCHRFLTSSSAVAQILYESVRILYESIAKLLNAIVILNQRTSGPVNAHLTSGPGIHLNAFTHVHSPRAGAENPLGRNVDVNRKPLSLYPFAHLLQVLKQSLHIFPCFSTCI